MQRSRRNSIFTKPTGTLTCGGYESTQRTSSPRLRRFLTADRTDCTYADTATIALYIGYDGCAMTGTTGTAAYARYDGPDDTIETLGRAERQPVGTACDSIGQDPNNSTVILCNNADESTTEYCRYVPQEFSQTFTYDPLNRLTENTLGGVANQSWTLDSQGNWSSFTSNGTMQTRTANAQNQITSISGTTATPTYDANGNMTTDQSGNTYVFNAWNQLVSVKNASGQLIAAYTYDARGYRISESYPQGGTGIPAGTIKYLYYSNQEQVIEERWNGTASNDVQYQYVWSNSYVNAMVLRDAYSGGALQANDRIYTEYDTNFDVTALVGYDAATQTWGVTERFVYSPYGTVTVLSPTWAAQSDAFNWQYMYQGGRQDPITGLYHFDHRDYSTSLGTWVSQDPLQYINGANTYQFVMGNPINKLDPQGTGIVDCVKALGDLALSTATLARRTAEIVAHGGCPDQGHIKALQQAVNKVEDDLAKVAKHCSNWIGAAALMAAAEAAIEEAAPYLIVGACCAA